MKTKPDNAMGLPERLILEFVRDRPGLDTTQVGRALSMFEEMTKDTVSTLLKAGYLERSQYCNRRLMLVWTGKPFPPSSEFSIPKGCPSARRTALKSLLAAKAMREAISVTCDGMRAMMLVGRGAA
ncbi:hypothetical protein ACTXHA_04015 [Burkholderia cenocepacia]